MCILCFDGDPPEKGDPYAHYQGREWETGMMHAGCNNLGGCCCAMFFPCCMAYTLRERAIGGDWSRYKCCQGYICPQCFASDGCNKTVQDCPKFCMVCELFWFEGCAISATRIMVQDERNIRTDRCDNRIIRFNNIILMLSCLFDILAIFHDGFRLIANILDLAAHLVYCATQACMQAQTDMEMTLHPTPQDYAVVETITTAPTASLLGNQGGAAPPAYTT